MTNEVISLHDVEAFDIDPHQMSVADLFQGVLAPSECTVSHLTVRCQDSGILYLFGITLLGTEEIPTGPFDKPKKKQQ